MMGPNRGPSKNRTGALGPLKEPDGARQGVRGPLGDLKPSDDWTEPGPLKAPGSLKQPDGGPRALQASGAPLE